MARIRGANTSPELKLREALESWGICPSTEVKAPVGRPDLTFPEVLLAVFIDGCFWHGCPLHYARPRSRADFWSSKLVENLERDARQSAALEQAGWRVLRLCEHEIVVALLRSVLLVGETVRGVSTPRWREQRRVRSVVEVGPSVERREIVRLAEPQTVIETTQGRRITAKARRKQLR